MDVSDLTNAEVFAVLYNAASPQGLGFLHYNPEPMTVAEAENLIGTGKRTDSGSTFGFDYHKGRVMKVKIGTDEIDTRGFNRDNGENAAERAIESYRKTKNPNNDVISIQHALTVMDKYPAFKEIIDARRAR